MLQQSADVQLSFGEMVHTNRLLPPVSRLREPDLSLQRALISQTYKKSLSLSALD